MAKHLALTFTESLQLFDFLDNQQEPFQVENGKVETLNFELKLPFVFKEKSNFGEIVLESKKDQKTLFLLVQSGSAALGYSINGIIQNHKVIKKYMIRKKQGKAQLKHLNAKGKSRLGSRIRLQQADKFFNEIHEKIEEWNILSETSKIFYSYSKTLIPFIFDTPDKPILAKNDERLTKLPFDLEEPNFKTLQYMNKTVHKSILIMHNEKAEALFIPFLNSIGK